MQNLDLKQINTSKILSARKVFFIGIGGIGISAIARMMLLQGKEVFGSDINESGITNELKRLGANIALGQRMDLIPKDTDQFDSVPAYSLSPSALKLICPRR